MLQQLIAVALPLPIHKCFTYAIPQELHPAQIVGSRVLVPFGKQTLTGMAVMEPIDSSAHDIKPMFIELLDESPIFNHNARISQVDCRILHCIIYGETIKAALPAGMSPHSIVKVAIKQHLNSDELDALKKRAPKRAELYQYLQHKHGESLSAFSKSI